MDNLDCNNMVRLNKYLKDLNICSRRKADDFILKGFVKVNGVIVTELGLKIDLEHDKVELLPELMHEKAEFKYILFNKPKGYVCSKNSNDGKIIYDLLPDYSDLAYAGRLDKDSHGLLILSNDGKFVYKVAGSENKIEKEYIVRVNKPLTANFLLMQGNGSIKLDGKYVKKAKVTAVNDCVYKIVLTEGINRQIRRMAENQGYRVVDLKRIRIGRVQDSLLQTGAWRSLTVREIDEIFAL